MTGDEVSAGAAIAASLLNRELTVMGWIANGLAVCTVLLIVLFAVSLWRESRRPVTHIVLGALPDDMPADAGDVGDSVRMLDRWLDDEVIAELEKQPKEGDGR